jgi:hypothetical protein
MDLDQLSFVSNARRPARAALLGTLGVALAAAGCGGDTTASDDGGGDRSDLGDTIADVLDKLDATHDEPSDCVLDGASETAIILADSGSTVTGDGAAVAGHVITIRAAGTYRLSGALTDGRVVVSAGGDDVVRLVLDGVSLASRTGSPLQGLTAGKLIVILAANSQNSATDATTYASDGDADAALFSKTDLTVCGDGALSLTGNLNDAIAGNDGLIIKSGDIDATAVDDGIRGKDYLVIEGGDITVSSGGDGLKSDNEEDATRGYILVTGGHLDIDAGGDAITAATEVMVSGGVFDLYTGPATFADVSQKGIKGLSSVLIEGGDFAIDADDDAIHSNDTIIVSAGTIDAASGDDGLHADLVLGIKGGEIIVSDCYEGLESLAITIQDGVVHITASDDGLNATGGSASRTSPTGGRPGGPGNPGGGFGVTDDAHVYIDGGWVYLDSSGDGLDSNGHFDHTGGTVLVNGPTGSANSAIDCNGEFSVSGGLLVSVHTEQMSDEVEGTSTQNMLRASLSSIKPAGTLINITNGSGDELVTFAPAKAFKALVFSSPEFVNGNYSLYTGGSHTESARDGLYQDGTYTPGSLVADFSVANTVTTVGNVNSGRPRP